MKIKVACLPVAGPENPYQALMLEGLNISGKLNAYSGIDDRFFGIIRTVLKYKPDYIHFDWITNYYVRKRKWMTYILLPFFYLQILCIKYFTKTKIVWTLHNVLPHDIKSYFFHKMVRSFFGSNCKWIRVFSETTIVAATKKLTLDKRKFIIVPEGDYTTIYPNQMSNNEARKKLKIEPDKKVLLYLGYIKPYKGLENLIHAFSKLKTKNIELIIAGKSMDAHYFNSLEKNISNIKTKNIKLINRFIRKEELQLFYNAADAVVLPFDKIENSGSVIMAMGFKKAILAPKLGVLEKRLVKQHFLLYEDLLEGLNSIFEINSDRLEEIGFLNFMTLQKYKWQDFAKAFK